MVSKTINIHNIIDIEIDEKFTWREAWLRNIDDVIKLNAFTTNVSEKYLIKVVYTNSFSLEDMRKLEESIYIKKNALLDLKYRVQLESPSRNLLILKTDSPCLEWLEWLLQIVFLGAGFSFIHGAAIEKEGKALVFPSWGGVGKTALVTKFVRELKWGLLGDDLVLLSEDGTCYGFPKPMVLYPYHRDVFPDVFSAGKGPLAPVFMNNFLTKTAILVKSILRSFPALLQLARKYNPQSVRIRPSEVFGRESLSKKAKLKSVIWIDRMPGISEPELHSAGNTLPSRIMGSTINEFDPWCVRSTNVCMGLGIINLNQFYSAWQSILNSGLQNCSKHIIYIPVDLPVNEVPDAVNKLLKQHDIWED